MAALPPLKTAPPKGQVALRLPDERDIALAREASGDPLIPLITTVPSAAEWTEAEGEAWLERQLARPAQGRGWIFTIAAPENGEPLGSLFVNLGLRSLGEAELGYWTGPSHRGRGYAAEAVRLVRDWALNEFGVERIVLYIDPENTASSRTAQAAGFKEEATLPGWEQIGNQLRPMSRWAWGGQTSEPGELAKAEHRMWIDDYRFNPAWLDLRLHPDFREIGASGRSFDRSETMAADPVAIEAELPLEELRVHAIDEATWLVTSTCTQPHRRTRRSSLWVRTAHGLQLRFHQGTPAPLPSG